MFRLFLIIGVCSMSLLFAGRVESQTTSYFGDYLVKINKNAQQAMNAQSLESLQIYARKTMEAADAFQQAAQSANDDGFVSQAVDIYTYAQRAMMSSSFAEAYEYMARAQSYIRFSADQAERIPYEPAEEESYHDFEDVSYRNYYDHNFDVVYENPYQY